MTIRPVSAAAPLTPLLTGPPTSASVLAVFESAALLALGPVGRPDPSLPPPLHPGPQIVALLTGSASGSPNGVRLPAGAADRPFAGLRPGMPATVGARQISTGDLNCRLVRTWRTAVPMVHATPAALELVAACSAVAPIGLPLQRLSALSDALGGGPAGGPAGAGLRPAVRGLVGLGQGLTPGGDDVLAGLMVGLRATGRRSLLQQVRRAIGSDVADRTTAVSADLLRLAAAGHASIELLRVLGAVHAVRLDPEADRHQLLLRSAVTAQLAVGHTSGADLLAGLLLGLAVPHSPAWTGGSRAIASHGKAAR